MYTLNVVASGKANRGSKTVDEYIIVMGHGCHFNWDVDYCIFKYVLHSAALANHEGSALPLAELRREPCTVLWGAGRGGLPISSALSHSTSVVSRTSGWAEQHSIHGYSILQMTLLHRGEGGGKKRTSAAREKRIEPRMKRDWNGRKSTGVRVGNERSKHRCLPEDHCSCTKSGAVRPTLSKAVSERSEGTDGEKVWELITSLWTSRDGNPGSFSGSRSNFTQKKCLRFPSLNLTHKRSEENSQNKRVPLLVPERWDLIRQLWRLHCWVQPSCCPLPKSPLGPPSHLPAPGECLLCMRSHCSAVEHTHGRCQGKEHEMSDFLLNASWVSEKQVQ